MENVQFTVHLDAQDADPEELDGLTRELLRDLREQPVESAELVRAAGSPPGTKGIDPSTAEISVIVGTAAIKLVVDLLSRRRSSTIRFDGPLGGKRVKFEGAAKDFAKLLALAGQSVVKK